MNQVIDFNRDRSEHRGRQRSIISEPEMIRSEDIHIRNYDHDWSYVLSIGITDSDGDVIMNDRYFLQPEEVKSVANVVPNGEYEVRASLDNSDGDAIQCRINTSPENTVVIEMGNGTFSLTQGLRA